MKKWCGRIERLWQLGIPIIALCITYWTNIKGWASDLNDAAGDATPLLGALIPPLMLVIGVVGLLLLMIPTISVTRRVCRQLLFGDEMRLEGLATDLRACAEATVDRRRGWSYRFMWSVEHNRQKILFEGAVSSLMAGVSELDIPVPGTFDSDNPEHLDALIVYLSTLETYALAGDLNAARSMKLPIEFQT